MSLSENKNLGETILDHYEKYLGEYVGADVYADEECEIQLLGFPETIKDCLVFATFGVSKYEECEVILPVDGLYDECAEIFANSVFYALSNSIKIDRGVLIEGADNIVEGFSDKCGKTALYFTEAYPLPDEFGVVDNKCHIYMGFFVSKKEAEYIKVHGSDQFEDILEEKEADVINLNRCSVIK
ncbi:MAG: suppressor of fused domain protein [Ruminococcus sp.]|nr:suppressor of fused domain protein [Ruminococcus sp.]